MLRGLRNDYVNIDLPWYPGKIPVQMNPLITKAEGYLELGLSQEAEDELEKLEGEDRTSNEVWVLRCKIY